MIVVLHFCEKDWQLADKNLTWCLMMGEQVPRPYRCVLAYDTETPRAAVEKITGLARRYFSQVEQFEYPAPYEHGWPKAPNWAFQKCAGYISEKIQEPWFWWEADAVPIRKGWLDDLRAEYEVALRNNCLFMGHVVDGVIPGGHMNGVAVYPGIVGRWASDAMLAYNTAWDVTMAKQSMRFTHKANHLIQHVWSVDVSGNATNGEGKPAHFASWRDVSDSGFSVEFKAAIYHRCKDGSLPDVLMANCSPNATATNVPQHYAPVVQEDEPEETPGKVGILIVTYWKDFPWLDYCLRAIDKYCSGFDTVFLAIPRKDAGALSPIVQDFKHRSRIRFYDEVEGKGMVQHMERIGMADQICPGMDYVLHMDADCIFKMPTRPGHYFKDGKPVYVVRPYSSLIDATTRVVSDCYQWKPVVERMLGEAVEMYTMCRHPTLLPVSLYPAFREHIERVQGKKFTEWYLEQKNDFPQSVAEWPAMGAWAWKYMHDAFSWWDASNGVGPKDRMQPFWSHGGLDNMSPRGKTARQEMEEFLK